MIKRFTLSFLVLLTFLLDVGCFFMLSKRVHPDTFGVFFGENGHMFLTRFIAFLLFWVVLSLYFKIYQLKRADRFLRIAIRLLSQLFASFLATQVLAIVFFYREPRVEDLAFFALLGASQLIYRWVFVVVVHALRTHVAVFKDKAIILGDGRLSSELRSFLENNPNIGFTTKTVEQETLLTLSKKEVLNHNLKAVFVAQENIKKKKYIHFVETAAMCQIPIYIFANHDSMLKSNQIDYFGFIPVYKTQFSPLLQDGNKHFKRLFDLIFSSLVILFILSWMYPLVGLLIKLESKGPILFVQNRNGLGNTLFKCFKFRSMTTNNSKAQAKRNDARVTKIGRIIRRTSIDEFPQFLNVFLGDMSVVGPRPHMEIHNANYEKHVSSFQLRHSVKPGITGMAQARGFRGEIKEDHDIINRIKYDIFYIRNWSFALDIKIIIRTVINIFRGEEKAY